MRDSGLTLFAAAWFVFSVAMENVWATELMGDAQSVRIQGQREVTGLGARHRMEHQQFWREFQQKKQALETRQFQEFGVHNRQYPPVMRFLNPNNQAASQAFDQRQALEKQQLEYEKQQSFAALTGRQEAEMTQLRQLWEQRAQEQEAADREAEEERYRQEELATQQENDRQAAQQRAWEEEQGRQAALRVAQQAQRQQQAVEQAVVDHAVALEWIRKLSVGYVVGGLFLALLPVYRRYAEERLMSSNSNAPLLLSATALGFFVWNQVNEGETMGNGTLLLGVIGMPAAFYLPSVLLLLAQYLHYLIVPNPMEPHARAILKSASQGERVQLIAAAYDEARDRALPEWLVANRIKRLEEVIKLVEKQTELLKKSEAYQRARAHQRKIRREG